MRRAAAIYCLLWAITCWVFWIRGYAVNEIFAFRLIGPHAVILHSGFGKQAIAYIPSDSPILDATIPQFYLDRIVSFPVTSEGTAYPSGGIERWELDWKSQSVLLSAPGWFTTSTSFLVAVLIAFAPRFRAAFRRRATAPPTPPPGG